MGYGLGDRLTTEIPTSDFRQFGKRSEYRPSSKVQLAQMNGFSVHMGEDMVELEFSG